MSRKPIDSPCPSGYPFRLYKTKTRKPTLVVGVSRDAAAGKVKVPKTKLVPVNVTELIAANGHSKTSEILKEFGPIWVCKEGKIYFKQVVDG